MEEEEKLLKLFQGANKNQDGFMQWCEQTLHTLNTANNLDGESLTCTHFSPSAILLIGICGSFNTQTIAQIVLPTSHFPFCVIAFFIEYFNVIGQNLASMLKVLFR